MMAVASTQRAGGERVGGGGENDAGDGRRTARRAEFLLVRIRKGKKQAAVSVPRVKEARQAWASGVMRRDAEGSQQRGRRQGRASIGRGNSRGMFMRDITHYAL